MTTANILSQLGSPGVSTGFKNRIINGGMAISQRYGSSAANVANTITYTIDRWWNYTSSATASAIQQVAGIGGYQYAMQITGSTGNTQSQIAQRIESYNCYDLANQTVTLSVTLASSSLTTLNWVISYPTSGSADNWSSGGTIISNGAWTISSTAGRYTASVALPSQAIYGLQIWFYTPTFTSGTLTITGVQLEVGTTATNFDFRSYGTELALCQRYYAEIPSVSGASTGAGRITGTVNSTAGNPIVGNLYLPVPMRAAPGVTAYGGGKSGSGSISTYSGGSGGQVTYNTNVSGMSIPFISANMFSLNLASIGSTQSGYSTWTDMGWASSQLAFVASAEL